MLKFKKHSRKGFTLVETVAVIAIFALIFVGMMTIYQGSARLTLDGERTSRAQGLAKSLSEELGTVLRYADTIDIQENLPQNINSSYHYVYPYSGDLKRMYWGSSPEYFLGTEIMKGYSYDVIFKKAGLDIMSLSVEVLYDDESLCTLETNVYMPNLMDASITGENEGRCICYQGTGITVNKIMVYSITDIIWYDGMQLYFYAVTYPRNASTPGVAWSVSDESIATIDQKGLLTPLKNGIVTVRATALDGSTTYKNKNIVITNQS